MMVQFVISCEMAVNHHIFHTNHYMVDVQVRVLCYIVLLEVIYKEVVRHLVARLEFLVILTIHLVAVVCQVDVLILVV